VVQGFEEDRLGINFRVAHGTIPAGLPLLNAPFGD